LEYRCVNCHGWKEKEYHPNSYKVHECDNAANCRKKHCPYWHNEDEMRRPNLDFRLYPRNRGMSIGVSHQYAQDYLRVMFEQPGRIDRILQHRKSGT